MKKGRQISVAKKIWLLILVGFGAALLAVAGFYMRISDPASIFSQATPTPTPDEMPIPTVPVVKPSGTILTTPTPSPTPDPEEQLRMLSDLSFMQNRTNILMLGIDESTERAEWGSFRTDTMVLLSLDFAANKAYLISIPRDSYVRIYKQEERGKINSAFAKGGGAKKKGFEYAMKTVSMLLGGIPVDYYVGFNMNVVKEIVDAMGGVDYDVDIEVYMNGRTISPGFQHLNGQQVLDYARMRKGSSDIARVQRQQKVLFAIFEQMKSTRQIVNIPFIYTALEKNIMTNLSFEKICALALFALKLDTSDLSKHMIEGEFLNIRGTSFWGVSQEKKQAMIKEVFGIKVDINPEDDVKYIKQEIEQNRIRIAEQLKWGEETVAIAQNMYNNAGLTKEELETLQHAIAAAQDSIKEEVLDSILADVGALEELIELLKTELFTRNPAYVSAQALIDEYPAKLTVYSSVMTPEEKSGIESRLMLLTNNILLFNTPFINVNTPGFSEFITNIYAHCEARLAQSGNP